MHLKSLSLRGFKSFASATTLRLGPGITCVVGPNGSGESNVVDTLAWVMGEQGAKSLHGSNMSDVIFTGTAARPALGRAQVDLTIDNTDGVLPIDYTEVTITRTLFRGGDSEYAINGAPARLLDIQELLSDTGMGRQIHVVVDQGRLDSTLRASPEERHGFIKEAAGVLKHRRRKEHALRKLADMDHNLVRVLDLAQETQRQLGPLARQARTAHKASLIQTQVRDTRARLLTDELIAAHERLTTQSESEQLLKRRRASIEERIERISAQITQLEERERSLVPALEQANRQWQEITALHKRLRGTLRTAQERVRNHSQAGLTPEGEDPEVLDQLAQKAGEEDAELLEAVERAKTRLTTAIRERDGAEGADVRAAAELARVNRVHADHRRMRARLTGDVASAKTRVEATKSEAERSHKALEETRERLEKAREALASAPRLEEEAEGGAANTHLGATRKRDEARAAVDALIAKEREAKADRTHWEARHDALAQSLVRDDDTSGLIEAEGSFGAVREFIETERGAENAIAALLSPFADAILVESVEAAATHVRDAERLGSGQLRMLIAGQAPAQETAQSSEHNQGPAPKGAKWARECATAKGPIGLALAALLDRAVVVEDLEGALAALDDERVRAAVTSNGAILRRESVIGSGAPGDSLLTLRTQLEDAKDRARHAVEEEARIDAELQAANSTLDEAIRGANETLEALRAEDWHKAKIAREQARLKSAVQAAGAEAARTRATAKKAAEHVEWAAERVKDAQTRLAERSGEDPDEDLEAAKATAESASAKARAAQETETNARLELHTVEERSRQAQSKARALRSQAATKRDERRRRIEREARRVHALEAAMNVEAGTRLGVEAAARALEEAEQARLIDEDARRETSQALSDARRQAEEARVALADVTGASQRDEIARAQLQLRVEDCERRAFEELSLETDALIADFGPHNLVPRFPDDPDAEIEEGATPFVRSEQEKLLEAATKELVRLGKVNPLALEEHDALAKRHEFLVSQVRDLHELKADLLRIIDDVDRLVEEAFASAFENTRAQFAHVFDVLFPGGKGELILTDPGAMLETGVEIGARPAGKKVKRISLLSGGEHSLAAIAFLVAIFKARPSPFYVMGEIEAALDDVNLSRLLKIFRELREESQLIVITHQKRTMEIAGALYGVTMRDGVTGVVSQRLAH